MAGAWVVDEMGQFDGLMDVAEALAESGPRNRIAAWIYGVVAAVVPASYGVWCVLSKSAVFLGSRPIRVVAYSGTAAMALGIVYFSVGLFLHCHFFWSAHDRYAGCADVGKLVSLAGIVGGVGYLIYRVLMLQ